MAERRVTLRKNVLFEPLFNRWYAWSHLVSPATAALNVLHHVKTMRSYLAHPAVHAAAARDPAMLGAPFLDCDASRAHRIEALLRETLGRAPHLVELGESIRKLDELLSKEASGMSLEPLYAKVPEPLRGFVELGYDYANRASFRLIEPLLYRSAFYDRGCQSVALSAGDPDSRPFVLSTPRVDDDGWLHANIPFDAPAIDVIGRARSELVSDDDLREALGIDGSREALYRSLVSEEHPIGHGARYEGAGVRVRYFGHACVLIETSAVSIMTDPSVSYAKDGGKERFSFADLPPRIDVVLLTHAHTDHVQLEILLQLRRRIGTIVVPAAHGSIVDPSLKLMLEQLGFENVVALDELETLEIDGASVTAAPFFGEHADLDVRSKAAYAVRVGERLLYFAADSRNVEPRLYERVRALLGAVDIVFIGMECRGAPGSWLYGPLMLRPLTRKMDHSRRLNGSDAAQAAAIVASLGSARVFVYAMAQEPWLIHISGLAYTETSVQILESNRLVEECKAQGISAERLFGKHEMLL